MNLAFVLFDYFAFGGLQRDCLKIAATCARRGHAITIFTRTWQGEKPDEIKVELLGRKGFTNISRNRHFLEQIEQLLPGKGIAGVVGFNRLPGLDVYFNADSCYVARMARLKPAFYRWLPRYKHFAALERAVFAPRGKTRILLLTPREIPFYQQFYGTESNRFSVLPPGITRRLTSEEQRIARRYSIRQRHGWGESSNLLAFVGSGFRTKGLDRAIRGLASLDRRRFGQSRLVVIGQNSPGRFALLARQLGVADRVHFLGGRHDVPDFLLASDLLVHPAYAENTGTVLLEAMVSGLPVLTTDVCGYAFHIQKANAGYVLPSPFVQAAFNATLAEILTSDKSAAWRANGLAYAAREDLYSCHERAADIIEAAARQKQSNLQTSAGRES